MNYETDKDSRLDEATYGARKVAMLYCSQDSTTRFRNYVKEKFRRRVLIAIGNCKGYEVWTMEPETLDTENKIRFAAETWNEAKGGA